VRGHGLCLLEGVDLGLQLVYSLCVDSSN